MVNSGTTFHPGAGALEDPASIESMLVSEHYPEAKARCFRQLLEALLFEAILRPEVEVEGDTLAFRIHGKDAEGRDVTYMCRGRKRASFGRIRLSQDPILRVQGDAAREADSLTQFMHETRAGHQAPPDLLARFIHEIEQTLLKEAQARRFRHDHPQVPCDASYDDLESSAGDGHPYHPGFKSRIGFDFRDNLQYGPEFSPRIRPIWLALHRDHAVMSAGGGMDAMEFLRMELGGRFCAAAAATLAGKGHDPREFVWCPVHPWQWRTCISQALARDIRNGRIVVLDRAPEDYVPQQSIRTLANAESPRKASLKLSMSLVNTSTSRILAPHTVANAPRISDWLAEIVGTDPFLARECRTVILKEVLGVAYQGRPGGFPDSSAYGALSCIWRESVHAYLDGGEKAAPWSLLTHRDPGGRPRVDPWIRRFGLEAWLGRILEVSVLPLLRLLTAHGLALESHAQNIILIHRDGYPTRIALKDFHDGVRFSPRLLARPERMPRLAPTPAHHVRVNRNSFLATDDPQAVRDFVLDAFLFINLGELALTLQEGYGFAEEDFWSRVRDLVSDYGSRFPEIRRGPFPTGFLAPEISVEKLANRRLFPESEVQVHSVANPLVAEC